MDIRGHTTVTTQISNIAKITWWQALQKDISARIDLLQHSVSNSLVLNQFIRLPNLFTAEKRRSECADTLRIQTLFPPRWKLWHRTLLLVFVSVTSMIYGSIHAVKWNETFTTSTEQMLWRIASCVATIGGTPVVFLGVTQFSKIWMTEKRYGKSWWKWKRWFDRIFTVLGVITGILFVAARTFLVVEAFIGVRHLTAGAYQTVKWMDFFGSSKVIGQE
jgi:hypothetical protein